MRNILKVAFIVIAILAISCDKLEDLSSKDLVGSWYLESVTYGGQPQGLSSCAKQSNIVFTETEYTKTEYAGIDGGLCSETHKKIGTYTTSGSKVLVKYKEGNNETVPTISISGKTLTPLFGERTGRQKYAFGHDFCKTIVPKSVLYWELPKREKHLNKLPMGF